VQQLAYFMYSFLSDIAIFVLKRDVKLQLTYVQLGEYVLVMRSTMLLNAWITVDEISCRSFE